MARITRLADLLARPALALLGAAIILPTAIPTFAHAQKIQFVTSSSAGGADFTPAISRTHFDRYMSVLGLEGDLKVIASGLLSSYHEQFRAEAEVARGKMDDLREEAAATQDFSVFSREMPQIMEAWKKKSDALEQELLTNLQALLTDEQRAKWPTVERERRRHDLLPSSRLSGESVDLIELVARLRDSERADDALKSTEIDQLLEQYAMEMDSALQMRERFIEPLQKTFFQTIANDPAAGEKIWKDATEKRKAVRDVNRRYLAVLKAAMTEERAATLEAMYMEQAYPAAHAPTKAEKFLALALELQSLTSDQASSLLAFEQSLDARLAPVRRDIVKYTDEQDERLPEWFQKFQVSGDGSGRSIALTFSGNSADESDPLQEALRARYRASKDVLDQAERVLTESQREALPEVEVESDMMRTLRIGPSML